MISCIFMFFGHYRCYLTHCNLLYTFVHIPTGCVRMYMDSPTDIVYPSIPKFVQMRDSNCVFLVYMVFLELLHS